MNEEDVKRIVDKYKPRLLEIKETVGVGIGKMENQLIIEVLISKKLPEHENIIPKFLEGVPVKVREVGVIKALDEE